MLDFILLRFDAPLMSFGGVTIDRNGITREFPARSMIAGLLGNALGLAHGDGAALGALQHRIIYAVRCDQPGTIVVTTRPSICRRRSWNAAGPRMELHKAAPGGEARTGTHIRLRDYLADATIRSRSGSILLTIIRTPSGWPMRC